MTVKKPAFIYSVIVKALKDCRLREDHAKVDDPSIDNYTEAVIIDMCRAAVDNNRDLRDFRAVCEETLKVILRLRRDSIPMIGPTCQNNLVKEGLMIESDDLEFRPKEMLGAAFTKNN
jgi:hypothetical protein